MRSRIAHFLAAGASLSYGFRHNWLYSLGAIGGARLLSVLGSIGRIRALGRSALWAAGATLSGLLLPLIAALVAVSLSYFPVGQALDSAHSWDGLAFLACLAIAAVIVLGGLIYSVLASSLRPLVLATLFVASLFFGFMLTANNDEFHDYLQGWALKPFNQRSAVLVAAIQDYERATGALPADLASLMPSYLASIPRTGMSATSEYEYETKAGPCSANNKWHLIVYVHRFIGATYLLYCPKQDYSGADFDGPHETYGAWAYYADDD